MANESISYALDSRHKIVILLLDFDKAYNEVSWSFLRAAMVKIGFSWLWVMWIESLYMDFASTISLMELQVRFYFTMIGETGLFHHPEFFHDGDKCASAHATRSKV